MSGFFYNSFSLYLIGLLKNFMKSCCSYYFVLTWNGINSWKLCEQTFLSKGECIRSDRRKTKGFRGLLYVKYSVLVHPSHILNVQLVSVINVHYGHTYFQVHNSQSHMQASRHFSTTANTWTHIYTMTTSCKRFCLHPNLLLSLNSLTTFVKVIHAHTRENGRSIHRKLLVHLTMSLHQKQIWTP